MSFHGVCDYTLIFAFWVFFVFHAIFGNSNFCHLPFAPSRAGSGLDTVFFRHTSSAQRLTDSIRHGLFLQTIGIPEADKVPRGFFDRGLQFWLNANRCASAPAGRAVTLDHENPVPDNPSVEAPCLLTLNEAARRLSICRRSLERLIAAQQFPRPLKIGRSSRVLEGDVMAYLSKLLAGRGVAS